MGFVMMNQPQGQNETARWNENLSQQVVGGHAARSGGCEFERDTSPTCFLMPSLISHIYYIACTGTFLDLNMVSPWNEHKV